MMYFVGKTTIEAQARDGVGPWTFIGLYHTESEAVERCTNEFLFVAPMLVGMTLDKDTVEEWAGSYFPVTMTEETGDAIHKARSEFQSCITC